jgi:hypothetical protein
MVQSASSQSVREKSRRHVSGTLRPSSTETRSASDGTGMVCYGLPNDVDDASLFHERQQVI